MGLIIDGNSEIGAKTCGEIGNLNCLRHLFRSRVVANFHLNVFLKPHQTTQFNPLSLTRKKKQKKTLF